MQLPILPNAAIEHVVEDLSRLLAEGVCDQSAALRPLVLAAGSSTCANAAETAAPTAAGASTAASAAPAAAADAPTRPQFRIRPVDDSWRASLPRAAGAATEAYLDRLPVDVVTRSNDYFEGGYWLQLWNFLLGLAVALILLAGPALGAHARLGRARRPQARSCATRSYGALYAVGGLAALAAPDGLPGPLARAPVRHGDAELRPVVRGAAHRPGGEPWSSLALVAAVFYAVLRRVGAQLVGVGGGRRRRLPGRRWCWSSAGA